jgi:WD40 repeat protein
MIAFACATCQKKLAVHDEAAGKKVKCPGCGQVMQAPSPAVAAPSAAVQPRTLPSPSSVNAGSRPGAPAPPPRSERSTPSPAGGLPDVTGSSNPVALDYDPSLTDFLAPPQADDELGRLGGFRILKVLGYGGMGVVFLGEDPKLGRRVAIKALLPHLAESKSAQQRFLREARVAAALEHDHIVAIHHVDEDRGAPFLVMPLLKGEPLDARLQRGEPLSLADVLRIGRETAEGLAVAHESGLVHRDIKPANLWLEAPRQRVKILDFGLARATAQESGLTQQGMIVGTPAYMAPEQGNGETVDGRCDLWSLGVVLYRMCTGQLPFKGTDALSTLLAVAMDHPPPPHVLNPSLPQALSDLVMKLLEKQPEKRLTSARTVVAAIQALEREATLPVPALALPVATPVAAVPEDPFANLTEPSDLRQSQPSPVSQSLATVVAKRRPSRRPLFLVAAAVALTALLTVISLLGPKEDVGLPSQDNNANQKVTVGPSDTTSTPSAAPLGGSAVLVPSPAPLPRVRSWTVMPRDHLGSVTVAAYRGDSRRVASGGRDGTVRLWDPARLGAPDTDQVPRILLGHTGPVTCLAWSPDGKTLASGSDDQTVRLWDAEAGRLLHTLTGHTGGVLTLAWSPDGKRLASGGHDQSVRLWEAGSGEVTRIFREHKNPVTAVAWRPNGKTLVSFSIGNNLYCLWAASSGIVHSSRSGPGDWAWSPDYKVLALKTGKNTVAFWDADADKVLRTLTLKEQKDETVALAWSRDGKILATGETYDYNQMRPVYLWDAESGKLLHTTERLNNRVCGQVVFSPDSKLLVSSGAYDHRLHLWQAATGKRAHDLTSLWHTFSPNFSPDGKTVWGITDYPVASGHTLVFWDAATANRRHLQAYRPDCLEAGWSPDGKILATVTAYWGRCQVRLWEAGSGQLRRVIELPGTSGGAHVAAWSPDGKTLAGACGEGVELWNSATETSLRKLSDKPAGAAHALAWSPDGKLLASFANEAWLWDPATGKALRQLTGQPAGLVLDLAWAPDGKTLATGNQHWAGVDLWDVASGKHRQRLEGHRARVTAMAWAPDGKTLASSSDDATVRLWDAAGKFLIDLKDPEHQGPITALTWLPGGKTLATLSAKNTVCVWDTVAGKLLRSVKSFRGSGRFSPDGRLLASINDVEGVRLWEAETGRVRGTLVFLQPETPNQYFIVSGDGHYRGVPQRVIDHEMVYVVQTERGQDTLTPAEFEKKYGWKNDPEKVRLGRVPAGKEP